MSEAAADEGGGASRGATSPPCTGDVLRTIPLLNAMVDVALVLGFDETCSKELRVPEDERREEVRISVVMVCEMLSLSPLSLSITHISLL